MDSRPKVRLSEKILKDILAFGTDEELLRLRSFLEIKSFIFHLYLVTLYFIHQYTTKDLIADNDGANTLASDSQSMKPDVQK